MMPPTVLVCLPFAGAGASFFRGWRSDDLRVLPVQLTGREERFTEAPSTDVAQAVDDALPRVLDGVEGGERVALFGHSMGAVLAFELSRRISAVDGVSLARLFVSGAPGPWSPREYRATGLDDEAFLAQVELFSGYSHPALEDPEMRALLLPTLRADVEMHENYRPPPGDPLTAPITTMRGRADELVSAEQVAEWKRATIAEVSSVEFDGGHMYLTEDAGAVLRQIVAAVEGD
jgi:surfactin synthase thioesterase subunit